jgi:hypothetical protein
MRVVAAAVLTLAAGTACTAAETPNFVCRGIETTWVVLGNQPLNVTRSTDVFRVDAGKLYVSDATRPETFYNTLEADPGDGSLRYRSGHKLFVLAGQKPYVVHAGPDEARVTTVQCRGLPTSILSR